MNDGETMTAALDGIRVLDLTRMLPGPYASMILADLGAQVTKIEDLQGDPTRRTPPLLKRESSTFLSVNRGKQSLALNLKTGPGVEIFHRLLKDADIVLEGFRPGVMERLGLGYDALRALQPGVIYCSISGYGQDGPMRDRSGHDINYLALAGVLGLQTDASGTPVLSGIQIADLGGALFAVIGILAALAARHKTGEGQRIDVSMMDVGVALLPIAAARMFANQSLPLGARLPLSGSLACYNVYATSDGRYLSVGALEPKFWERFCRVIGRDDFVARQNDEGQESMIRDVGNIIKTRTQAEWMECFRQTDACVEPVLSLDEAFKSPPARHRKMVLTVDHPSEGEIRQLNLPFKLSGTPPALREAAPLLGQHTRKILVSLGYTGEQIQNLIDAKIIAVP
jgi:crotonobetainyl-CoA:carnitine CoA-transferase CaiB-like acyl-CoA transferase